MSYEYVYNGQYKSIRDILEVNDFDIYKNITSIIRPLVGAVDHLRKMHRINQVKNQIDHVINIDENLRIELVDELIDIFSIDLYTDDLESLDNINSIIEARLSKFDKFYDAQRKLKSYFSNKLDYEQQKEIIKYVLTKIEGNIISIRQQIKFKILDNNEETLQLLYFDQIFYMIQELIKENIKKVDDEAIQIRIFISLIKIVGFQRNKVSFEDIQNHMSDLSSYLEIELPKDYKYAFELVNV